MYRDEIAEKICKLVEAEKPIYVKDISRSIHREDAFKQGLYFIYDSNWRIVYIGMVSDKDSASLYMRIRGNGKASHSKKDWWREDYVVKFHKFEKYSNEQLAIAERLAIIKKNQPIYNDKNTDDKTLKKLRLEKM